ncbi:HAMP domain-containing methyl-accepting chemotaxis protein [Carboxydochorda subterranea]|uniref:HAMP domain-containing methyl-accepting chemotaxis protein n=1 Tax=Carboxydichorda subterranea TaxID=3109565 RepID=A0ABZ1BX87_9FIRM|nr:HAMP domain-containing methyl-accepting chemotaxis protein [Limnochorda sp. L945t]WRP17411.1 HAMP domain-containing methyl-accepting chemotaxis protein [Limnochorda sp. L945t]
MNAVRNLRISTKLSLLAFLNVLIMVVLGIWSIYSLSKMDRAIEKMYQGNVLSIQAAADAERAARRIAVEVSNHALAETVPDKEAIEANIRRYETDFGQAIEAYMPTIVLEDERRVITRVQATWRNYMQAVNTFLTVSRANPGVTRINEVLNQQVAPVRQQLNQDIEELVDINVKMAKATHVTNQQLYASTRLSLIAVIAAGALLGFTLSMVIARMITGPLHLMVSGAQRLAEGDLTHRVEHNSHDEVGLAARALAQASDGLRRLIHTVRQSAEQVASSSEELASSSEEVGKAVQQVAETVDQVAKGSQRQSVAASSTSESARQMGEMVRRVAQATQRMGEAADQAAKLAQDGRVALGAITQRMDQIQRTVGESGHAVQDLGQRSQRIGQIVDVITGIAEQTNLLALNAAIEAARAGDQGRGFAVVAEEVRKLAEQSRQAASEIAALIAEIRQEVDRAVRNTEAGSGAVTEGVQAVAASGQTFEAIAQAVEQMVRQIEEVSAAAQQMAASSEQVVKAVDEIAAITEENAAAAEEVASSTEEQSSAVQEIASSAASLANMAEQLMKAVEVFKV